MRKPRVVIFSGGADTKKALKRFFDARGYEMMVFAEAEFCPFYSPTSADGCVCCDIVVASEKKERKNDHHNSIAQFPCDCRLRPRNKAVITKTSVREDTGKEMEVKVFHKPLDVSEFEAWVSSSETGMDLSVPLAIRRKALRRPCPPGRKIRYRVLKSYDVFQAHALNESSCGICIRTPHALQPGQVIHLWSGEPPLSEHAEVRWVQKVDDGTHLTGLTFCVA
jgi:hypothetical protein